MAWEQLLDSLDIDQRAAIVAQAKTSEIKVDKRSVKTAIESGAQVPGADVVLGRHSLRRR
jgi:hypothetical protein